MKKIIPVLLGIIVGYLLYYYIVMEVVTMFFYSTQYEAAYQLICYISLIATMCLCSIVAAGIFNRRLNPILIKLLYGCYFILLCYALFYRTPLEQVFIWNPFDSIRELSKPEMLVESVLNLVMFIPIGILMPKWKTAKVLLISILLSFSIELYQGISRRGYFDTFDILLYIAGIMVGYLLMQKIKERQSSK